MPPTTLGKVALGDPGFVAGLRSARDPRQSTIERVDEWMAAYAKRIASERKAVAECRARAEAATAEAAEREAKATEVAVFAASAAAQKTARKPPRIRRREIEQGDQQAATAA